MANVSFDVTRYYQIAQDTLGNLYIVQDGNWFSMTTQASTIIIPNGWKFLPQGSSPSYPGLSPFELLKTSIPVILPSSGTLSAAGALSAIQALQQTFTNGCWMYFPAATTDPGDPAGVYFVIMSSTTAGTVYRNRLVSGAPFYPAASALIPCTNAASYTQGTSVVTVLTIPIPANAMGPNGIVEVYTVVGNDLNAGTKTGLINFGGGISMATSSQTTVNSATPSWRKIANRGVTGGQAGMSGTGLVAAVGNVAVGTLNTTAAINLLFQLQIATAASNTCEYDIIHVILWPG